MYAPSTKYNARKSVTIVWFLLTIFIAIMNSFTFLKPYWYGNESNQIGIYSFCVATLTKNICGSYGKRLPVGLNIIRYTYGIGCLVMLLSASLAFLQCFLKFNSCLRRNIYVRTIIILQVIAVFLQLTALAILPSQIQTEFFNYFCKDCKIGWTYMTAISASSVGIFCPILGKYILAESIDD